MAKRAYKHVLGSPIATHLLLFAAKVQHFIETCNKKHEKLDKPVLMNNSFLATSYQLRATSKPPHYP